MKLAQYTMLLTHYLHPQWRRAVLLAVLLLGSTGLQLVNPLILRAFIDDATAGTAFGVLVRLAVLFIVVALATQVVTVAATYMAEQVGWTATNLLRSDLLLHCLRLDMPFHHEHTPGNLIERIDGDITAMANFFSQLVVRVLASGLFLAGVLVLLWFEDVRIAVALSLFAVVAMIVIVRMATFAVPAVTAERQASAELFGFLEERLGGLEDLRANGAGAYTMRRLHEHMYRLFGKARMAGLATSGIWVTMTALFAVGYALALGLGAWLYTAGAITIGTVYLVFQYVQMLRRPVEQIAQQLREMQRAAAGIERVQELLSVKATITEGEGARLPDGALSVAFDDVSFSYDGDDLTLDRIRFDVAPGRVLGVLGRTGSGKTTLTRLIFRLYDVTAGSIALGGAEIRRATFAELRQRVGIVTQDVQIFQASVRDNLTFFDDRIPDQRILDLLDELGLGGWARSLPEGLDTELSSGGAGLSAGEAQLLAFARVFLRDPGLVILDEASSRLDPATERLIEHAVDRLLAGRTGIIIAHRLGTVQRADEILILDDGRIAEYGPRAALAHNPDSRFAALLRHGLEEVLA
jgi:ABC-type multidrug transport system fused ATPase/permease subunit